MSSIVAAHDKRLRGRANIRKRYLMQAMCADLSLLMRRLTGFGTPKQALAVSSELNFRTIAVAAAVVRTNPAGVRNEQAG